MTLKVVGKYVYLGVASKNGGCNKGVENQMGKEKNCRVL